MAQFTLTLNLLTTTIVAPPSNARKWQMGINSEFKGLMSRLHAVFYLTFTTHAKFMGSVLQAGLKMAESTAETCRHALTKT